MRVSGDTTAAAVQATSRADAQARKQALDFEQLLLQQLTQSLAQTTQDDQGSADDGSDDVAVASTDSTSGLMQQMLPDALAQSLTDAGGIGLAGALLPKSQGGTA